MTIYYGNGKRSNHCRSIHEKSPDHGLRADYSTERPIAHFHGCCIECSVQHDPSLGIEFCRQCLYGPIIKEGENKWKLTSYSRPQTPEELEQRLAEIRSIEASNRKRGIDLYHQNKKTN